MDKRVRILITVVILVVLGLAFYLAAYTITKYTGYSVTGKLIYSKEEKIALGGCLAEKGVIFYCSQLSMYCLNQKNILGIIFNRINYVDCGENFEECKSLRGLPAWRINNRIYYGIQNLNKLVELSGCKV